MVLRGGQRQDGLPIGDGQDTRLFAIQAFLNDQLIAGGAEFFFPRDAIHGVQRSVRPAQTITPLPAASPSALTTTGTSSRSLRNVNALSALRNTR